MEKRESEDLISVSLPASLDFNRKVLEQFRLGMSDWTDSDSEKENYDDFEPPKKHQKQKLPSFVLGKQCFTGMVSAEEMESISRGLVPKNMAKNMKWVVSTFGRELLHKMSVVALWVRI